MSQVVPDEFGHLHQRVWAPYDHDEGFRRTGSGLIIPYRDRKARYGKRPLALDLFCGCGGFSLGFIQAGWRVIAAVENEPWAALTYMHNLGTYPMDIQYVTPEDKKRLDRVLQKQLKIDKKTGLVPEMAWSGGGWISSRTGKTRSSWSDKTPEYARATNDDAVEGCPHFWFGDIRAISGRDILDVLDLDVGDLDAVIGGPPCQGFSTANSRRSKDDPRNELVFEFCRLVVELQPKTMMMENVPELVRMTTPEGVTVIEAICRYLEDGGYGRMDALRKSLMQTAGLGAAWKEDQEREKAEVRTTRAERRREQKARRKQVADAPLPVGQMTLFEEAAV